MSCLSPRTIFPDIDLQHRYGTLLGTQFFQVRIRPLSKFRFLLMLTSFFSQSFIGGIVAFRTLSRPQFAALQAKIFPIYFGLQTALPAILAVTYPGARSPLGTASGLQGTFAEVNRWSVLAPLATMFVAGLANLLVIGPTTTKIMAERKQQGMSYSLLWNV